MTKNRVIVGGMHCENCVKSVTKAIQSVPGVIKVAVDLKTGMAEYESDKPVDKDAVVRAISDQGFEAKA